MNLHLFSLCTFVLLRLSNLSLAAIVQITGALNKKATKPTGTQMGLVTPIMTVSVKLKFFKSVDQFLMRWLQYPLSGSSEHFGSVAQLI